MTTAAMGVVVPAHNEELLVADCLDALAVAVESVDLPVHVVVTLDACTDDTADIVARYPWVTALTIDARCVGEARRRGAAEVLQQVKCVPTERVWIATTDADTLVPSYWLAEQARLADDGWDVIVGTVAVVDWTGHAPDVGPRWVASYFPVEHHSHVHGANFGCSAAAYLDAGGFQALARDEDVALLAALSSRRVLRTAGVPVVTSSRLDPRAAGGFGDTLRELAG